MVTEWYVGDRPRFRFLVVDEEQSPPQALDPTTVRFTVRPPVGPRVVYTYGAPGSPVVRDATGSYYLDVPLTRQGTWFVRAEGLDAGGVALLAREGQVEAPASNVLP